MSKRKDKLERQFSFSNVFFGEGIDNELLSRQEKERRQKVFSLEVEKKRYNSTKKLLEKLDIDVARYKQKYKQAQKELNSLQAKQGKLEEELSLIENEHNSVKNNIEKLNKDIKAKNYYLNASKVKLQKNENPELHKMYGIYLGATTVIGILLSLYYFLVFSKG